MTSTDKQTTPNDTPPDDRLRPETGAAMPGEETVLAGAPLFRSLFDHHAAVSLLIDPHSGRIIDANEAAARFYGWSREHLRQMSIHQINTLPPEELHAAMAQAASSRNYHFEFAHRRADGSIRTVEVLSSAVEIAGQPLLFSIVHDITDRKQADALLRQQAAALAEAKARVEQEQRLLSAVLDALPTGVAITNRQGGTLLTNAAYEHIWGGSLPATTSVADYAAYKAWWDATGEPVQPEEWASAIATRTGRAVVGQVMRLQRFDGSEVYVINSAAPVFDHNGQLAGCAVAIQDITALKCTEQALRDKTEDFNRAQEVGHIGSWRLDLRNNVLTWSDENYRIFGLAKGTPLRHETFLSIVHPDDRAFVDADWRSAVQSGTPYVTEHRIIADGRVKWVREEAYLEFDDNKTLIAGFGITQDITERKQAEEALRVQERTLRTLIDAADESIWLVSVEGEILAVNQTATRRLGLTPEAVLGRKWQTLVPAELAAARTEKGEEILRTGQPVSWEDRRGEIVFEHFACPVCDEQGAITAFALFSRDVSERRAAEAALRRLDAERRAAELRLLENEARFRLALDAASNGVWDCNLETGEVYRGENWHCTLGYDEGLPPNGGDPFVSLVHPDDLPREQAERKAHLQGRTDRYEVEYRMRDQAGEWRWMLSRGRVIERDAYGHALRFTGTITDITRLKEAEAALQRSQAELEQRVRERTVELSESNVALSVLLKKREQDRAMLAEQVVANAGNLLEPFLERLHACRLNEQQQVLVDILQANLRELTAPFTGTFSSKMARLTPAELQVANLIKLGKRSKEIAEILHLAPGTVNVHRKNIRKKLDIDHQKANLQTLLTLES
jgi:PAS domain S-box-containing protein